MNKENELKLLEEINRYADQVLKGIDPDNTPISIQLEKLKPKMEELAQEFELSLEEIFVKYMDLNLKTLRNKEEELKSKLKLDQI